MERLFEEAPLDGAEVPPTRGPKLGPFEHPLKKEQNCRVQILEYISDPKKNKSGIHAHVLAARIGTRYFALKFFKFIDVASLRSEFFPLSQSVKEDRTMVYHSDPFYAECRAYGRIKQLEEYLRSKGRSKSSKRYQMAIPCYGYLAFPADPFEKEMEEEYGITQWDRPAWEQSLPASQRRPFRVLVKKLARDPVLIREPKRMRDQFELLAEWGVYPSDLNLGNYIGGYLVDLSFAWTTPSWQMRPDILTEEELADKLNENFWQFNIMMESSEKYKDKFYRAGPSEERHKDPVRSKRKTKAAPLRKQPIRESRENKPVNYNDSVQGSRKV